MKHVPIRIMGQFQHCIFGDYLPRVRKHVRERSYPYYVAIQYTRLMQLACKGE